MRDTEQTDAPTVSVILPVRNAEKTLATAITSIVNQSFTSWELLVADDGSFDRSLEVASQFAKSDSRIRILRFPATGLVPTLNEAISVARGEFIARMDADDIACPHRLLRQCLLLKLDQSIGVVSCHVLLGGDQFKNDECSRYVEWSNSLATPCAISKERFVGSPVVHPTVLFRSDLLRQYGGYRDGDFPEDYELWLRWLDVGVRFAKVNSSLLIWNDLPDRLSRTDPRYGKDAFCRIKCHYLRRWLARNIPPERPIWLWGANRANRKRFVLLERLHGRFQGFVDIDPERIGLRLSGRLVVHPDDIPSDVFVVAALGTRVAQKEIRHFLQVNGRIEGEDFLLAA